MKKTAVLMIAIAAYCGNAIAQKPSVVTDNEPGWRKIGETTAKFQGENEAIHVIGADEFAEIRLKVTDAPLEITRLQVFYESGEMEEIDVRNQIQAGAETNAFKLKHADRDISKVAFTYKTVANTQGDKATVELHGLKRGTEDSEAYRKTEDARQDAQEVTDEAGDDIDSAAERTEHDAERVADEVEDSVERESAETERDLDRRAENTERDLEGAAEKTGDAISKAASDVEATITDKVYEGKVAPGGQKIYIDDRQNKFYYINYEGKKVYITKIQMKDKVD